MNRYVTLSPPNPKESNRSIDQPFFALLDLDLEAFDPLGFFLPPEPSVSDPLLFPLSAPDLPFSLQADCGFMFLKAGHLAEKTKWDQASIYL